MKTLSRFALGAVAVAVTVACNNAARPTTPAPVTVVITRPPNGFRVNAGKSVRVAAAVQHGTASDVTFVVNGRPAVTVHKPPYETVLVAPMDRPMRLIARAQVGVRSVSSKELYIIVDSAPPRPEAEIITDEETAEDISGPMIGRTGPTVALTVPQTVNGLLQAPRSISARRRPPPRVRSRKSSSWMARLCLGCRPARRIRIRGRARRRARTELPLAPLMMRARRGAHRW